VCQSLPMSKPTVWFSATLPRPFPMLQACLDVAAKTWGVKETDAFLVAVRAGPVAGIPDVCRKYFDVRTRPILPSHI
jgi:hypothetical protein